MPASAVTSVRSVRSFRPVRSILIAAVLAASLAPLGAHAQDPQKKTLTFGATAGPYADQIKWGIKPILEKQGYSVKIVEFADYVQPNHALADGALDANAFQHIVYLKKFAADHKLPLSPLVQVPTAPIGLYSKKFRNVSEVKDGARVAIPNDPTNLARALFMLQDLGWIKVKAGFNPVTASEKDVESSSRNIKLVPLEAAQLPRSLEDTDFSFVNGNFAIASGLKLTDALKLEAIPDQYMNLVAVRSADQDRQFVKDIAAAYRSAEFGEVVKQRFAGFYLPKQ
jgi:D-methionine transport system substrate-binding protein